MRPDRAIIENGTRSTIIFAALMLAAAEIFVAALMPFSDLFSTTLMTGGDIPSHFPAAVAMRDQLFSGGSIFTWLPGNYAGFPLFQNYFPLPFILIALISVILPIQIAFKLGTIIPLLLTPVAVFSCIRRLGYEGVVPALGAAFSTLFLIMSDNTMWGGNIASTMAGEFAYGMSLVLAIYFTGKIYDDAPQNRSFLQNALLEALIALSHGYPLLQTGLGTSWFFARVTSIRYILSLHLLAFALIGFWIVPLLWRLPWDTSFQHTWNIQSWREVVPPLLLPAFAGIPAGLAARFFKSTGSGSRPNDSLASGPEAYLWWQAGVALLGFAVAPLVGLVDIRFLPFAQIFFLILGAIGWGKVLTKLPHPQVWAALMIACTLALAAWSAGPSLTLIRWNYSGFEARQLWPSYYRVNDYLQGDENNPRVVYEHSDLNNGTGTVRCFEILPLLSGRSTLEGLYMQSSISSPFAFYIQSELSQAPSCPFPEYSYSRFDPDRAAAHLRLFNVNQVIAVSDSVCRGLDRSGHFISEISFPPYRIYRVKLSEESYAVPLRYRPFRIPEKNWKQAQYEWLRKSGLDVPLVVSLKTSAGNFLESLDPWEGPPEALPRVSLYDPEREPIFARAHLDNDRITVTTTRIGHPLWIKVSFHPDWTISEGSGELYCASPGFMLLVPNTEQVVLKFDTQNGIYCAGKYLTALGLLVAILAAALFFYRRSGKERRPEEQAPREQASESGKEIGSKMERYRSLIFPAACVLLACIISANLYGRGGRDPMLVYYAGLDKYNELQQLLMDRQSGEELPGAEKKIKELEKEARAIFDACIRDFPQSPVIDHAVHYKIGLLAAAGEWNEILALLQQFRKRSPDSRAAAEGHYFSGKAHLNLGDFEEARRCFWRTVSFFPDSPWAPYAAVALIEVQGADRVLKAANACFGDRDYAAAGVLFDALTNSGAPEISNESGFFAAYCKFYQNRWEEASDTLLRWLNTNMEHPKAEQGKALLRQCQTLSSQKRHLAERPPDATPATGADALSAFRIRGERKSLFR